MFNCSINRIVHNSYMPERYRIRRIMSFLSLLVGLIFVIALNAPSQILDSTKSETTTEANTATAILVLEKLQIKGRAPKTDYSRDKFGAEWAVIGGCNMRNIILNRDMTKVSIDDECNVDSGILNDPYSGKIINFKRGSGTSSQVQIDHVVALSDAWQKGAQQISREQREQLANDPLNLIAVDGPANQAKGDGDAATWLPPNKAFRCQYVARQIAVKQKYNLWVTRSEFDAIASVLNSCPGQL